MNKIIAFVGMPGAGKTEAAKYFQQKGFLYLRFGQIVLDEAIKRGQVNEKAEREIRNGLREKYGMGAMAKLSIPQLDKLLKRGDVVVDDLYSWDEYKILKEKYGGSGVMVVAVCASPKIRYQRLVSRHFDPKKDKKALYRSLTLEEAKSRDYDQIENAAQGGPIAMADYFVVNEGTVKDLYSRLDEIL